jgi:hypothetical protein
MRLHFGLAVALGLFVSACEDTGNTSDGPDGGGMQVIIDAGHDGGVGSANDPCGVAGTWQNGCPTVPNCGHCTGNYNLAYTFTIPAEIARSGGNFTVGNAQLSFNVATCTLTVSGNSCTPMTPDEYTLRNGAGTGTARVHCRSTTGNSCVCSSAGSCEPRRQ